MGDLVKLSQDTKSPTAFRVYNAENRTIVSFEVKSDDLLGNMFAHVQKARPDDLSKWVTGRPASEQLRNEIWVAIPEWTYEPATPLPPAAVTAISVSTVQIASGATAAFDAARKDFVKLRQKVGYPYRVVAYRVVLGEPRIVFVTPFDSRAAFYGANAFMALVEKAGAQSEWQALQTRLSANMGSEWDSKVWNYNAAVSYVPQP